MKHLEQDGPAAAAAPSTDRPGRATPGPAGTVSLPPDANPVDFLAGLVDRHGDVVRFQTPLGANFLFVRPDHVQAVLHDDNFRRASLIKLMLGGGLLASDGTHWRSQRRLMQPDFLPDKVAPVIPVMTRQTAVTAAEWAAATPGQPVDVAGHMTRLTLRVIVEALFGDDLVPDRAAELCAAVTQGVLELGRLSWMNFGSAEPFTAAGYDRLRDASRVVDQACYDMIARRRATPLDRRPADLLTLLVNAFPDPAADRSLRDEIVTMMIGGHETTALALSWTWKALSEAPHVEARLHAELDEVLGDGDAPRAPCAADLPRLAWTRAVVQETMRLYPPVWYLPRVATEDAVIDGHPIPRNACVMVSPWFTHRHAPQWPDAERFDPGRFLDPAASAARHRYAYFPFGGGRHLCLGIHLGLAEGTVILAQLASQFRLRGVNGPAVRPHPGITLRQSPAFQAIVERRHHAGRGAGA